MNKREKQMINVLRQLKEQYGVTDIKVAMEAEGIYLNEILRTKLLASASGLGLSIKIGGCEAITDARLAREYDSDILLAPMIESGFALEKFLEMAENLYEDQELEEKKLLINIETGDGVEKIETILKIPNLGLLSGIVVGRTDLSGALDVPDVNDPKVLEATRKVFVEAKKHAIHCLIGGGISAQTISFMDELGDLVDGFETRKIVFYNGIPAGVDPVEAIHEASRFEYLWYLWRRETYQRIAEQETKRIEKMASRFSA